MAAVMATHYTENQLKNNKMFGRHRKVINLNEELVDILDAFTKLGQMCEVASKGRDPSTVDSVHNYDQAISKSSQQQKQRRTEETSKGVTHDDGPALKQRKKEKRLRRKSSLNKNDDSVVPHSRKRMESVGFDISNGADEILLLENKRDSCRRCSKSSLEERDEFDEGHLQCTVQYENKRSILIIQSMNVRATMSPGMPGFFVSVTLLPIKAQSVRSKVYVTAQRDIDLPLREVFRLNCTKQDLNDCSLFVSVNPMFGNRILYAETDLKELNLENGMEVQLGGYLKGMMQAHPEN